VPKALRPEFPRLFTDELCNRRKHAPFDCHLAVKLVILVEATQALYRQPVEHDAATSRINVPTRNNFTVHLL
jgi:hypothetical protein